MSMQYTGGAQVDGVPIAVTGATVKLSRKPILPELVWGKGWKVNYASGHFEPSLNLTFPLFQAYIAKLKEKAIGVPGRDTAFTAFADNGGVKATFTECKVESWTLRADALGNSPVECTLGLAARDASTGAGGNGSSFVPNQSLSHTPIPAYALTTVAGVAPSNIITAVDINVNNNPFRLYTLNGEIIPVSIQLGLMIVTGTFTYYSAGVGGSIAVDTNTSLTISGDLELSLADCLITDISDNIEGPNRKPMRVVSFEAIGTANAAPIV